MNKPLHEILIRPILTEKSVQRTQLKKYSFVVALSATKNDIARAVEELFAKEKIVVESVNTMHVRGKQRRNFAKRGRQAGHGMTSAWKKAVVTLTKNSPTIPSLEGA